MNILETLIIILVSINQPDSTAPNSCSRDRHVNYDIEQIIDIPEIRNILERGRILITEREKNLVRSIAKDKNTVERYSSQIASIKRDIPRKGRKLSLYSGSDIIYIDPIIISIIKTKRYLPW